MIVLLRVTIVFWIIVTAYYQRKYYAEEIKNIKLQQENSRLIRDNINLRELLEINKTL